MCIYYWKELYLDNFFLLKLTIFDRSTTVLNLKLTTLTDFTRNLLFPFSIFGGVSFKAELLFLFILRILFYFYVEWLKNFSWVVIGWFQTIIAQTFQPTFSVYRRGNFVYQNCRFKSSIVLSLKIPGILYISLYKLTFNILEEQMRK